MQILPNAQDIFSKLIKRLKKVYRGLSSNILDELTKPWSKTDPKNAARNIIIGIFCMSGEWYQVYEVRKLIRV
jgi:hypothetical protein